jgi:hypothetical protein
MKLVIEGAVELRDLERKTRQKKTIRAVNMKTSYGYRLHANGELIKVDQDAHSKP